MIFYVLSAVAVGRLIPDIFCFHSIESSELKLERRIVRRSVPGSDFVLTPARANCSRGSRLEQSSFIGLIGVMQHAEGVTAPPSH